MAGCCSGERCWSRARYQRTGETWQQKEHTAQYALVDGTDLLASAKLYNLAGVFDQRPVHVCGIGAVFTEPARRGGGHARALVARLLDDVAQDGADMALLFSEMGRRCDARNGFEVIPTTEVELSVAESPRHGAPMTMVRGGEERDLAAVVAMGQVRAGPFRFHLDRAHVTIVSARPSTEVMMVLPPIRGAAAAAVWRRRAVHRH